MKRIIRRIVGDKLADKLGSVKSRIINLKEIFVSEEQKEEKHYKNRKKLYAQLVSEGELCFDVGANVGNRILPLLDLGAKVVAIEPQESCYTVLQEKFGDKIELVTEGLGSLEGEKDFYVSELSVISTFSEEWKDISKETVFGDAEWKEVRKLKMTTLDNLIVKYGVPVFIKIDVEGYEIEVLKGLSTPVRYLSFEYMTVNPVLLNKALECVKRLIEVDKNVVFNYAIGESMKLEFSEWMDGDSMCKYLMTQDFKKTGFGDVYAHVNV